MSHNISIMVRDSGFDSAGFTVLISRLFTPLFISVEHASSAENRDELINPVFLAQSFSAASRLEELLDHYNANNNQTWKPFRENISAVKCFSNLSYITLHLRSTSPQYKLLSGIETFLSDTDGVLGRFSSALHRIFPDLLKSAKKAGLDLTSGSSAAPPNAFCYPEGRLPSDFKKSKVKNPEKVIVNLATLYLNLASESLLLKQIKDIKNDEYGEIAPDIISEDSIRLLECKFHNLQSIYDTHISNTDIEDLDEDLKLIRGHASIVYHLLEASTGLIHYYERHMMDLTGRRKKAFCMPLDIQELFNILIDYYLNYSEQFLTAGKALCKEVIGKYAEEGSISVKVPVYRGFHVRPSTLLAKIVQHYGSDVNLIMGNEKFDASSPMNLFRVNEKINAQKRRTLSSSINSLKCVTDSEFTGNFEKGLKEIFHRLLEENKIINYSTEFSLPELQTIPEESLGEFANRAIANLLAEGKIDLRTDIEVEFVGDKRVLSDIAVLAECGYGEDSYGNNTILPEKLSYIRR